MSLSCSALYAHSLSLRRLQELIAAGDALLRPEDAFALGTALGNGQAPFAQDQAKSVSYMVQAANKGPSPPTENKALHTKDTLKIMHYILRTL